MIHPDFGNAAKESFHRDRTISRSSVLRFAQCVTECILHMIRHGEKILLGLSHPDDWYLVPHIIPEVVYFARRRGCAGARRDGKMRWKARSVITESVRGVSIVDQFRKRWEGAVKSAAALIGRPVVRPIRSRTEFDRVVSELDALVDADPRPGTAAYDRMELLTILISAYEDEHLEPIKAASPQELVRFMAEHKGVSNASLAKILGGRSRLSEFFNGTRDLSKAQILRLRDALGIPADLLLGS